MTAGPYTIGLAPMEGVTGYAARIFFRLASAPTTVATPFLRLTDTFPGKSLPPAFAPELFGQAMASDLVVQFMAVEADDFLRAADLVLDKTPFVEINCGCPSPVVVGKGAGSSLLKDVVGFHAMMERLSRALGPGRFALKMRTGFATADEFPDLLAGLGELNLARLTVHGRTRPDGYRGRARWDLIARAAEKARAPVMASGDVVDFATLTALRRTAQKTGGAIIGRGALRNPWIFEEIREKTPQILPYGALRDAILAFALLHDLGKDHAVLLAERARDTPFTTAAGRSPERWRAVVDALARLSPGQPGAAWPYGDAAAEAAWIFDRTSVGRLKLLWNYFRSSLPPVFFAPEVLRARTVGDLLARVDAVADRHAETLGTRRAALVLPLLHAPEHDWMYSGASRQAAAVNAAPAN